MGSVGSSQYLVNIRGGAVLLTRYVIWIKCENYTLRNEWEMKSSMEESWLYPVTLYKMASGIYRMGSGNRFRKRCSRLWIRFLSLRMSGKHVACPVGNAFSNKLSERDKHELNSECDAG
ncbi:hypothetical protein NPIL_444391 [Nephila pilipes]|uniref:Uncharacterized protein n=1 Tax=Nephila pilipes TaxID=299642 RepID=A0A8X6K4T3_NEPPI|nr:hypothetical protein NPIL_444391 [Nephila pilipes]